MFLPKKTLNLGGSLIDLSEPRVMGILNVTPDSFFDGGRYTQPTAICRRAGHVLQEGASFIDVGGMSTPPGGRRLYRSMKSCAV